MVRLFRGLRPEFMNSYDAYAPEWFNKRTQFITEIEKSDPVIV